MVHSQLLACGRAIVDGTQPAVLIQRKQPFHPQAGTATWRARWRSRHVHGPACAIAAMCAAWGTPGDREGVAMAGPDRAGHRGDPMTRNNACRRRELLGAAAGLVAGWSPARSFAQERRSPDGSG